MILTNGLSSDLRFPVSPFRQSIRIGGWVGEEAVALALYCYLRYPDSYEKVVIRGANTNGDSDSIACIAGSISGAYLGKDAVPLDWVRRIEKAVYLEDLAQRLADEKEAMNG